MKKKWIGVLAFSSIIVGLALIAGVFFAIDFNFARLNTESYQTGTYLHDTADELNEIEISSSFFDVKILPMSAECEGIVRYPYNENIRHEIEWTDGKLTIRLVDGRKWYEKWSVVNVDTQNTIEVYLPHGHYEKLKVLSGSGDVCVMGTIADEDVLSFGNVSVETGSGDIDFRAKLMRQDTFYNADFTSGSGDVYLNGIQCVPVSVSTRSGSITLKNCISTGIFTLYTSSGDVWLEDVVSTYEAFIFVNTDTGDVKLSRVMIGAVKVITDTGDVEFAEVVVQGYGLRPNGFSLMGGDLRIETGTGEIELERSDAQSLFLTTDTGDVELELLTGKYYFVTSDTGDVEHPDHEQHGQCHVTTDTGDVMITVVPE